MVYNNIRQYFTKKRKYTDIEEMEQLSKKDLIRICFLKEKHLTEARRRNEKLILDTEYLKRMLFMVENRLKILQNKTKYKQTFRSLKRWKE